MSIKAKQITKEALVNAISEVGNDKSALSKLLGVSDWKVREQLKLHGLHEDKRDVAHNKIEPPPKEELRSHYNKNLTMGEIGAIYGVSNVTAAKWFKSYGITLLSHSDVVRMKAVPKTIEHNKQKYGTEHYFASDEGKKKLSVARLTNND